MRRLLLVGIGTGNPDHLTQAGIAALREADAILIPRKGRGKEDLADLRDEICRSVLGEAAPLVHFDLPRRNADGPYRQRVDDWHDTIAETWRLATPPDAETVALLVWGDPSLYDSTLRIAERLDPKPEVKVVPGITSLQALTAAHAIPLNEINAPVTITTGRQLRDNGWPEGADTIAVMLDGECSFLTLPNQERLSIWWGAYLGMPNEVLISGLLSEVGSDILSTRETARANHGWIMDIYLLRRRARAD